MPYLLALIAGLVFLQDAKADEPVMPPTILAGTNAAFQQACLHMEERLEAGDFGGANRFSKVLPKWKVTLAWDDSAIPLASRLSYAEARDLAARKWASRLNNCEIKVVGFKKGQSPPPDILVSFVESIPPKEEDPLPPAAAHFFSEDPAEPRLECVLSLKRGRPSVATDYVDIHNEVGFAIAQYFGVERSVSFGYFSSRTDVPASSLFNPSSSDLSQAKENLRAVEQLTQYATKQQRVLAAKPKIHIDTLELDGGQVSQGDVARFQIQITNNGNAPLHVKATPDCSCVSVVRNGLLPPGETKLFAAQVDLTEVVGEFSKSVLIYSNDFEKTVTRIPIRLTSKPLFRLLAENDGYVLMKKGGASAKVYLVLPNEDVLTPLAASFVGVDAKVRFKPWSGELADPDLHEAAKPRNGYVFELDIADQVPPGQTVGNLFIKTNHPKYAQLQANLVIQKGILAMPEQVNYGEIPAGPRRAFFLLSRPGKGFQIKDVSTESKFLNVVYEARKEDWEYKFTVQYDGKADRGPFASTITIKTDDPSQPTIVVPVSASIR